MTDLLSARRQQTANDGGCERDDGPQRNESECIYVPCFYVKPPKYALLEGILLQHDTAEERLSKLQQAHTVGNHKQRAPLVTEDAQGQIDPSEQGSRDEYEYHHECEDSVLPDCSERTPS